MICCSIVFNRLTVWLLLTAIAAAGTGLPQSVSFSQEPTTQGDLLGGFDQQRLANIGRWVLHPADDGQRDEAARLLFQIQRLASVQPPDPSLTAAQATAAQAPLTAAELVPGQAIQIRGRVVSLAAATLPPAFAAQVELPRLYVLTVNLPDQSPIRVLSASIPTQWLSLPQPLDEATSLSGIVIANQSAGSLGDTADVQAVIATADLAWYPTLERLGTAAAAADWALLAQRGFDLSQIAKLQGRDRRPLLAADRDAFYPLLAIAARLHDSDWQQVATVQPAELLQTPADWIGRRLRMRCKAVRATRVMLVQPELERLLGSDHYWQIDALGDLQGIEILLQSPDSDSQPAVFAGQFPVSLVCLQLPDFLAEAAALDTTGDQVRSDVGQLARQVMVEGVFYRLWSYDSALMQQHGGGQQFGPLILASQIIDQEPVRDPRSDQWLTAGTAALGLLLLGAAAIWVTVSQRGDRQARARRRQQGGDLPLELWPPQTPQDSANLLWPDADRDQDSSQSPPAAP